MCGIGKIISIIFMLMILLIKPEIIAPYSHVKAAGLEWGEKADPKARFERFKHAIPLMMPIPNMQFYMSKNEITVKEYEYFCQDVGQCLPDSFSKIKKSSKLPITNISWYEANEYAAWLTNLDPCHIYRLPTSKEWLYAARGGTKTDYYWGNSSKKTCLYANVADEAAVAAGIIPRSMPFHPCNDGYAQAAPVGSYRANPFGLFDIIGNVWEWVADCDSAYETKSGCSGRIVRGGSWFNGPKGVRLRTIESYPPSKKHPLVGFRLVRQAR